MATKQILLQALLCRMELYFDESEILLGSQLPDFDYVFSDKEYYNQHMLEALEFSIMCHAEKATVKCLHWLNTEELEPVKSGSPQLAWLRFHQGHLENKNMEPIITSMIENIAHASKRGNYVSEFQSQIELPILTYYQSVFNGNECTNENYVAQKSFQEYWSRNTNEYGNPGETYDESLHGIVNWKLCTAMAIAKDYNILGDVSSDYTPSFLFETNYSVDIDSRLDLTFEKEERSDLENLGDFLNDLGIEL